LPHPRTPLVVSRPLRLSGVNPAKGRERCTPWLSSPLGGGSTGIPNKNLIDFCGKPLLAWSILQAAAAKSVDEVFVSSNDPEILAVGPTIRGPAHCPPPDLATDHSSSEEALDHALGEIERLNPPAPEPGGLSPGHLAP